MSGALPIRIAGSAAIEIREAAKWWRSNRDKAPAAFREELDRAFELIATQPTIGARALDVELPGVRRILLARVRYHLYYRVVENPRRVEVLSVWHANRGSAPRIA